MKMLLFLFMGATFLSSWSTAYAQDDQPHKVTTLRRTKSYSSFENIVSLQKNHSYFAPTTLDHSLSSFAGNGLGADLQNQTIEPETLAHLITENPHIEWINFTGTSLTAKHLIPLSSLENLRFLNMSYCGLTDHTLQHLPYLPKLIQLNVSRNQITDNGLGFLDRLPDLKHLNIVSNLLSSNGINKIGDYPLTFLWISENYARESEDPDELKIANLEICNS